MKQSRRPSFQKTLAFAATVAALGASVGVPVEQALGLTLVEDSGTKKGAGNKAVQQKADRAAAKTGVGAIQQKADRGQGSKAKAVGGSGGAGSNVMLNPQPLPPKQGFGDGSVGGQKSPTLQK